MYRKAVECVSSARKKPGATTLGRCGPKRTLLPGLSCSVKRVGRLVDRPSDQPIFTTSSQKHPGPAGPSEGIGVFPVFRTSPSIRIGEPTRNVRGLHNPNMHASDTTELWTSSFSGKDWPFQGRYLKSRWPTPSPPLPWRHLA